MKQRKNKKNSIHIRNQKNGFSKKELEKVINIFLGIYR
jgi:hypothetical protein